MENVSIAEAGLKDLNDVAFMFDQYRQFYDQDEDLKLAKEFLGNHMKNHTSIIFLASFDGRIADLHNFIQRFAVLKHRSLFYMIYLCSQSSEIEILGQVC